MKAALILQVILWMASGCVSTEQRFERVDGDRSVPMPLMLQSVQGVRDGNAVNAVIRFAGGAEYAELTIAIHLGPPAEFRSGTHRGLLDGRTIEGSVDCESLTYLGGQSTPPSIGGTFVLNNEGSPAYRVKMPATLLTRAPVN